MARTTAREVWQREDFIGSRSDAIRIAQRENAETEDMFGGHDDDEPDHPDQLFFDFTFDKA